VGRRLLVTGGAGFIGSAFVRNHLRDYADDTLVVLDKLTYAGNLANLAPVAADRRYQFVHGDIGDAELVAQLMRGADIVVNCAAETHVDRSILAPGAFIETDVRGTWVLLEAARRAEIGRFVQVSTDEVYGEVPEGASREDDALLPRSPYAASKAGGELMVNAYHVTYGLPTLVTRASNNYGPYQYPEKFLPLLITRALDDQPIPLYGDGRQRRDWLYMDDHCAALERVIEQGKPGTAYNIGGGNERENRVLAEQVLTLLGKPHGLIQPCPTVRATTAATLWILLGWKHSAGRRARASMRHWKRRCAGTSRTRPGGGRCRTPSTRSTIVATTPIARACWAG